MEDMLNKIIEMDENARKIKEQAEQEKLSSEQEIDEMREKIYRDYIDRAKDRIEKNIAVDKEIAAKKLRGYTAKVNEAEAQMQRLNADNHDRWVDEIVRRVLA